MLVLVQDRTTQKIIKIEIEEYFVNPSKYTLIDYVKNNDSTVVNSEQ